jgi:FkbM family methyltransferase
VKPMSPVRHRAAGPHLRAKVGAMVLRPSLWFIDHSTRRGYVAASRALGRVAGQGAWVEVRQPGGARFRVPMAEGYWLRRLWCDHTYEPELAPLLADVMRSGGAFLDCGANYGWWSLFAAAHRPRTRTAEVSPVVAVEAGLGPLAKLRENVALNDGAVTIMHRALWTVDGDTIEFSENYDHPEVSSIAGVADEHVTGASGIVRVETICLDSLLALVNRDVLCAVKLDVEGVEVQVLSASSDLARDTVMLLYEDHGRYPECEVSAWLIDRGWRLYAPDDDGVCRHLSSVAAVRALKTDVLKGYNFVAVRPGGRADQVLTRHM